MNKKIFSIISVLLIAAVLFTACSQSAATEPAAESSAVEEVEAAGSSDENRVLKVWHYESDTGAMGKAWIAAKDLFEERHPGVTIELDNTRGFEQIRQTASMILNSDEAPDVMEYNKGNASTGLLSQQGLLTDMTSEVEARGWDEILTGGMQTTSRYEDGVMGAGNWYGVTNYGEFVLVYYNKDMFAEYDLEVPTTFEEFEDCLETFASAGIVPIGTGATEYPAQQIFYELVLSKADIDLVNAYELYQGEVDFHGEAFTFGAEKMLEWVEKGYIDKNSTSLGAEDMGLGFESGEYPMIPTGSWWYGRFMEEITDFDWGIFLFPGNTYNAGSGGNLWVIPENSENKDLAYEWIEVTLDPEIQTYMANEGGLPVNANLDEITDPKVQEFIALFDEFSPGAAFYPDWPATGLYDGLVGFVQELINGTMTPTEMLDALDTFYNENKTQ